MEKLKENIALIFTLVITVLIIIGAIVVLSMSESKKITDDERAEILIRDDSQIKGVRDSKIQIVEFSDFECPACASYHSEFKQIREEYTQDIAFVFRHFPLVSIHPLATRAATASEAAGQQGKFWEYHDILYEKHEIWTFLEEGPELDNQFIKYAQEIGVENIEKFKTDLDNQELLNKVKKDQSDANDLNINATPTIFVNGKQIKSPTYDNIKAEIERLLTETE